MKRQLVLLALTVACSRTFAQSLLWEKTSGPVYPVISLARSSTGSLFAGTRIGWTGYLYKSTDSGDSWMTVASPGAPVYDIACNASVVFFGSAGGRWSTDDGTTWHGSEPLAGWDVPGVAAFDDTILLAATFRTNPPYDPPTGALLRSNDNGVSWLPIGMSDGIALMVEVTPGKDILPASRSTVWTWGGPQGYGWHGRAIDYDRRVELYTIYADSSGNAFVGTSYGVYRSTDNGVNWQNIGLTDAQVFGLITDRRGHLFAATPGAGVFRTSDMGQSWELIIDGLTNLYATSLVIDTNGFLYVGTNDGVFRSTEPTTAIEVRPGEHPTTIELLQNFPNPFNPNTTIRYALAEKSYVALTVFNTLGQLMATLVEGETEAGYHEVQFDAAHLASGVYLYLIRAGTFIETRKMMVVK